MSKTGNYRIVVSDIEDDRLRRTVIVATFVPILLMGAVVTVGTILFYTFGALGEWLVRGCGFKSMLDSAKAVW